MDFTSISFPGVGIEPFKIKSTLIGQFSWSTLIILVGAVLAFFYVALRAKKKDGVKKRITLLISAVAVALGCVFARATYVLMTWNSVGYTSVGEVLSFGDGMSIGGGLIGGLLAVLILCDILKIDGLHMMDLMLPGMLLVQLFAAIGTFFDAELFGSVIGETTSFYFINGAHEIASGEGTLFGLIRMSLDKGGLVLCYHPVFLYAFVWNLIGFLIAHFTYKHTRFDGQMTLLYFTWFGLGNAFIAGLDAPVDGGLHGVQLLALIVGVLALVMLIVRYISCFCMGIKINGEVPEKRTFSQEMNADERMEKRASDVAYITGVLDDKADQVYENMTAEPAAEPEEEEAQEA